MKRKFLIGLFLVCLIAMAFGAGITAVYILPMVGKSMVEMYPEAAELYYPCLFACDGLLLLFIAGIGVILWMVALFATGKTFSPSFIYGLYSLVVFCVIAVGTIEVLYGYIFQKIGGPGPGPTLLARGAALVIITLAVVFALWADIVKEAMKYKEEVDYTV